jgi:hypothetical protein
VVACQQTVKAKALKTVSSSFLSESVAKLAVTIRAPQMQLTHSSAGQTGKENRTGRIIMILLFLVTT